MWWKNVKVMMLAGGAGLVSFSFCDVFVRFDKETDLTIGRIALIVPYYCELLWDRSQSLYNLKGVL